MVDGKKVIGIIQSRLKSTRLPGKAMLKMGNDTLLGRVIKQAKKVKVLDEIWVATTINAEDCIIEEEALLYKVKVFRGEEENVLQRFCDVARLSEADIIVRITADNPFIETSFIEIGVKKMVEEKAEYVSFADIPYGSGVEMIDKDALYKAEKNARNSYDKEHVTPYIIEPKNGFYKLSLEPENEYIRRKDISVTVDTIEDYIKTCQMLAHYQNREVSLEEVIKWNDLPSD